jgi:peptidoglycan/xylan/chitin deacetylase (PgdA/CDA1 family)
MKYLFIAFMLVLSGCIQEASLANWPYGHKSAVCPTFEAEIANREDLERVIQALGNNNATFFVVPGYFQDNPKDLELLKNFEVANMGWTQDGWKNLSGEFQMHQIIKARSWLLDKGFDPVGFRAPFLNADLDTYDVLEFAGYEYDSSQPYGFFPYKIGKIVEIPLSIQHDVFWSELNYSLLLAYVAFEHSYKKDGLFTFYAHVKTASKNVEELKKMMDYFESKNVWVSSCREIARWWKIRKNLEFKRKGENLIVKNLGNEEVTGATIKISPVSKVKGGLYERINGETMYVVLPNIGPREKVKLILH